MGRTTGRNKLALPPEELVAICREYLRREKVEVIALVHDIHPCTVQKVVRRMGTPRRPRGRPRLYDRERRTEESTEAEDLQRTEKANDRE